MKFVTGTGRKLTTYQEIAEGGRNNAAAVHGAVHLLRDMGGLAFFTLRMARGAVQCVCAPDVLPEGLCEECCVELSGTVREEPRAPGGVEIAVESITVLSRPAAPMPVSLGRGPLRLNLDTELALRPVVLRRLKERAVFKVQEGLVRSFRDYLTGEGFTEVHTPKIVRAGAEGGSNIFKLDYFGKKAYLAQSPQFYKQTMVGVFERVFEVGPVFRAEKHATPRHLNEYTGLDFEMGYIDSFYDVIVITDAFDRAFERCDLLLTPVAPSTAPKLGESLSDPLQMYLSDVYTVSVNLAGLPGLSMPCGFDGKGLPIGAQLIGPHFGEGVLLNAAHAFQQDTDYHKRTPEGGGPA